MVTVAYNAYCAISMEGDDDTCDGKTAGSRSWEVEATVNSLVGTLFHVIITRMGTDLIFLSRLGSTICFTNFGSHDPIVLYWNPWYTEPCYKGSLLYLHLVKPKDEKVLHTVEPLRDRPRGGPKWGMVFHQGPVGSSVVYIVMILLI